MGGTLGATEDAALMGGGANPYSHVAALARAHGGVGNQQLFNQQTAIPQEDLRNQQLAHIIGLMTQLGQMAGYAGMHMPSGAPQPAATPFWQQPAAPQQFMPATPFNPYRQLLNSQNASLPYGIG